jgi:hypothetical protein
MRAISKPSWKRRAMPTCADDRASVPTDRSRVIEGSSATVSQLLPVLPLFRRQGVLKAMMLFQPAGSLNSVQLLK